jgi:predicted esterase
VKAIANQHSITTPKTGRYYTLGDTGDTSTIWIALHGYGQLARSFISDFQGIAVDTRLIVVPEALSRFYLRAGQGKIGANWMTSEDRENEISDYVTYLDRVTEQVLTSPDQRVFVLGFSQGSATACRWFARTRLNISGLLIWAGGIPPDLDFDSAALRLGNNPLRFVLGDEDQFMPAQRFRAEIELLTENNIPVEARTFAGKHCIDELVLAEEIVTMESLA